MASQKLLLKGGFSLTVIKDGYQSDGTKLSSSQKNLNTVYIYIYIHIDEKKLFLVT